MDEVNTGGTIHDAPNQEVVGVGPPWQEGSGGPEGAGAQAEPSLETMTKAQLIAYAGEQGIDVDESWTKADIVAEIQAAE